ncbi:MULTISPECIES: hypothetical protein [Cyanophyceae]|uniref:hypothetical protein n=1 Tax=Cyanophyceae TaxID=3028117 RepID=UPI00074D2F9A|nr:MULTISPECIES: hypothetical protein [Cyanophyceae]MBF2083027.1 hypothetical protein [Thermoleptolyngbya sp. C42_A2020_037]BAU42452.1 hypothetical protein O77CONTIG1_02273 [Leptolyngbya sp. O-77]
MQKLKPEDVLLSVATVPLLAGLVAARAIAQVMVSVGQTSEELFRGDRLPTLHVHSSHDSSV